MSLASDIGSTNPELLQLLSDMSRTDAWAEFVDRYGPMIHRICAKWSLPFHEREEIRSHVLIKIVETFLKPELRIRTSFRGYLFQMITNEILLHLRKKRKNAKVILLGNDQLELFGEFSNLLAEQIQSIETDIFERLASLQTVFDHVRQRTSVVSWEIFWTISVKGLSTTETAVLFGKTRITVWKANQRVLQMIRQEIAGQEYV